MPRAPREEPEGLVYRPELLTVGEEAVLEPRSGYVLAAASRTSWQHSIPPAEELRYSITFRTLRK